MNEYNKNLNQLKTAALNSCNRAIAHLRETMDMLIDHQQKLEDAMKEQIRQVEESPADIKAKLPVGFTDWQKDKLAKIHEVGWDSIRILEKNIEFLRQQKKEIRKQTNETAIVAIVDYVYATLTSVVAA